MELTIFFAKFWGSLFMLLGGLSVGAKLLSRVIGYTENRTVTIATGYITMLLGLFTVVAHSVWVLDWPLVITVLGWGTLLKGIEKVAFPDRVHRKAQLFKNQPALWGAVIFLIGACIFWIGVR